jgi:hypothetical protein
MTRALRLSFIVLLVATSIPVARAQQNLPKQVLPEPELVLPTKNVSTRNTVSAQRPSALSAREPDQHGTSPAAPEAATPAPAGRIYAPTFAPPQLTLSSDQLERVRDAVVNRTLADHEMAMSYAKEQISLRQHSIAQLKVSFEEDAWTHAHRRAAFERHAINSQVIFWMTLIIVLLGLLLTIWQFTREQRLLHAVMSPILRKGGVADEKSYQQAVELMRELRGATNLKFGTAGVELGTQIIGLIVLAFSLGFFYLFLAHVYPLINE